LTAFGVDHVQISVPALGTAIETLSSCGYTVDFEEPDFSTTQRPYFRERRKSMAYLRSGSDAVELIDGSGVPGPELWLPVFHRAIHGTATEAPAGIACTARLVPELGGTCLASGGGTGGLERVVLRVADPEPTVGFLEGLGFLLRGRDGCRIELEFPRTIVTMALRVTVISGGSRPPEHFVDDLGCTLVALISRNLEADVAALQEDGCTTTQIFSFTINGKPIRHAIIRGPGGALVELIEVGRKT